MTLPDKEKLTSDLINALKKAWDSFEENDIQAINKLLDSIVHPDPNDQDIDYHENYWFYDEFKTATNTDADFYHDMRFEDFVLMWGLEDDNIGNTLIKNMVMTISK